jgi:hypothetical protein
MVLRNALDTNAILYLLGGRLANAFPPLRETAAFVFGMGSQQG